MKRSKDIINTIKEEVSNKSKKEANLLEAMKTLEESDAYKELFATEKSKIEEISTKIEEFENALNNEGEEIEEATTGGMQMRTYESKKNAAIAAIAVGMAKKNKDPMYERLIHHRHAWKSLKNQLLQRYYSQAAMKWQAGQNK